MTALAWVAIGVGSFLFLALTIVVIITEPDYDEYPDGRWPGRSWLESHRDDDEDATPPA